MLSPEPPPLNLSQPGDDARAEAEAEALANLQAAARDAEGAAGLTGSYFDALPTDDEVPDEILEFFQPEAEEHLQVVSDCLLSLEGNNNPEEINRLFRAIHTVKGSAAQVGLRRLGAIAHRVEDLIGRMRDGEIQPSPAVVDLCLESVDVLKKTLHREWADEADMRAGVDSLLGRIADIRSARSEEEAPPLPSEQASSEVEAGPSLVVGTRRRRNRRARRHRNRQRYPSPCASHWAGSTE